MNSNLLYNLHRLAIVQDENFITESFSYILQKLIESEIEVSLFILNNIFGEFYRIGSNEISAVSIATQISTPYGKPDIEIKGPSFLFYIEAKIESGFGIDQLDRYRRALNESGAESTALITFTRYPLFIEEKSSKPDKAIRWHQIVEWLEEAEICDLVNRYLRDEFITFMKLRGIAMEPVRWELTEGIRSFQNLLTMISEALSATNVSIYSKSGAWDWHGYYIEDKHFFIGIYLSNPSVIELNSEVPLKENIPDNIEVGMIEYDCWKNQLDMSSEDIHFFARNKQSQLLCIEEFIKDSIEFGRKLLK